MKKQLTMTFLMTIVLIVVIGSSIFATNCTGPLSKDRNDCIAIIENQADSLYGLGNNGIYCVGDYYNRDFVEGVVFEVTNGGREGKIVSLHQTDVAWYNQGGEYWLQDESIKWNEAVDNEWRGELNTNMLSHKKHPIKKWCKDMGSNWYIPSKQELLEIYRSKDLINATISKNKGEILGSYYYWSSTECSDDYAWSVEMETGEVKSYNKCADLHTIAVSYFPINNEEEGVSLKPMQWCKED